MTFKKIKQPKRSLLSIYVKQALSNQKKGMQKEYIFFIARFYPSFCGSV
jgi:hypothetical protein